MMKKLLVLFSIILITILPIKTTIENFNRSQVQSNKPLEITKLE